MIDQATELRRLVLSSLRDGQPSGGPGPRLVVLTSGRAGVGVTSLGVNLSVTLSEQGLRVILVDAEGDDGQGVAALCGLAGSSVAADGGTARRDIHEAMRRGPAGIQVVPGWRGGTSDGDTRSSAVERLVRQLAKLGRHSDLVVIGMGRGSRNLARRLAPSAADVIVVTTPDFESTADAYAYIKFARHAGGSPDEAHLAAPNPADCGEGRVDGERNVPATLAGPAPGGARWRLIVNMAEDEWQARDVHQRLNQSCVRFLGNGIELLGFVPLDSAVRESAQDSAPFVLSRPGSGAARAVQAIAAELAASDRCPQRAAV
jgi:flagellar biosynthesis protein FlhG